MRHSFGRLVRFFWLRCCTVVPEVAEPGFGGPVTLQMFVAQDQHRQAGATSSGPKVRAGFALAPDRGAWSHVSIANSGGLTRGVNGCVALCAAKTKIRKTSRNVQSASPAIGSQCGTPVAGTEAPHVSLAPVAPQPRRAIDPNAAPISCARR